MLLPTGWNREGKLDKEMTSLGKEMAAYDAIRADIELDYPGRWVVFYDEILVGDYKTFEDAAEEAVIRFGRCPYLIRKVGQEPLAMPDSILYTPI